MKRKLANPVRIKVKDGNRNKRLKKIIAARLQYMLSKGCSLSFVIEIIVFNQMEMSNQNIKLNERK